MSNDQLKIAVVDEQLSLSSLGLFKASWLHQTAWGLPRIFIGGTCYLLHFCKGVNMALLKYLSKLLVLLVTVLLDLNYKMLQVESLNRSIGLP